LVAGAVLAAVVPVAAMAVPKVVPPGHDPCKPVLACGDDLDAALFLEGRMSDHLVSGHVVDADYRTPERVAGDVHHYGNWGDSGLWTGTYLAAQSYRYAVASRYLEKKHVSDDQRAFWTAQRDEARARVGRMVDQYHLLTNIASTWRTELMVPPYVNPTDPADRPNFGGGVIQGERGMLLRSCSEILSDGSSLIGPAGANKRLFDLPSDPDATWEDGKRYRCETAPSRDTYAGTTFGLLAAYDLVGGDDPALRDRIRGDVLAMAGFLVKYGWNYPRPHGYVAVPGLVHDFDGFISPLFVYVPAARLNMALAARHVAAGGTVVERAQWEAVWAEELASQGPILGASMEVDALQPNDGYYKYNLHHLTAATMWRLSAGDPAFRLLLQQALGVMDHTTGDDLNAHFEAITYGITGEDRRLADSVQHLREWRDYRARTDAGIPATNSSKCGVSIECVPEDQLDVMVDVPAGDAVDVTVPGMETKLRARRPLPVADRPQTDFLWQRSPTQLDGGDGAAHEAPGVDYLLPYWMLRFLTEVDAPALAPFLPWPGPRHE
jgi:hypothetical protein